MSNRSHPPRQLSKEICQTELTFIILARTDYIDPKDISQLPMVGDVNLFLKGTPPHLRDPSTLKVNQSIYEDEDKVEDDEFEAELEIMIAGMRLSRNFPRHTRQLFPLDLPEPAYRRKGLAYEALQLMISYATSPPSPSSSATYPPQLPIPRSSLVARITDTNMPSIKLFERAGLKIVKRVAVFQEVEMRWDQGGVGSNSP